MQSSKQIEDLLAALSQDRRQMYAVFPYLPSDLREYLLSDDFVSSCLVNFKSLDKDGNGSLDHLELYPVILDMANAHHYALDLDQCKRFTDVFDDERTGVISQNEFVNFTRFVMVMSFLQTEDGKQTLMVATEKNDEAETKYKKEKKDKRDKKQKKKDEKEKKDKKDKKENDSPASPQSMQTAVAVMSESSSHAAVDVEFFQHKSERLTQDNDDLRSQVFRLEDTIRRMESRLDDQERLLRHAEVDLRNLGKTMGPASLGR